VWYAGPPPVMAIIRTNACIVPKTVKIATNTATGIIKGMVIFLKEAQALAPSTRAAS